MSVVEAILVIAVGTLLTILFAGFFLHKKKVLMTFEKAQSESKKILEDSRREADSIIKSAIKEAKEESKQRRKQFEEEARERKSEAAKLERKIQQREQSIDSKITLLDQREEKIKKRDTKLALDEKHKIRLIAEYELSLEKHQKALEKVASMSAEEARKELITSLEEEARKEAQHSIRKIEEEARKEANHRARHIVSLSVQRLANEYVNEATVSVVTLPNEEMKGRIIGREGRNIRALEQATGVDLIIDDTPEAVILSCFNPYRREIAKKTMERLISDGRIHPARIEETVQRVTQEFETIIKEYGEQASFDTGVVDLHPAIVALLGKLRYRSTGVHSVLQHAVETAQICGMIAAELGENIKKAKRAGLLHDIGKALDHEVEGNHADLGADLCAKYGESEDIVDAVRMHHADDLTNASSLAVILGAANSLSENRPGARKELMKNYIQRLTDMEDIAKSFPGIDQAYVLQAGREIRALVSQEGITDEGVRDLANQIATKLRKNLTFPGQVRVTVLRESKYTDYAT